MQPGEASVDVVALSLPGQYVVVATAEHPQRFGRIVLISPTGFGRFKGSAGRTSRNVYRFLRLTEIGRLLFAVLARRQVIRWFLRQIFADPEQVPREYERYCWRTCQQPGAFRAPLAFVSGLLNDPRAEGAYQRLENPTLLLFGIIRASPTRGRGSARRGERPSGTDHGRARRGSPPTRAAGRDRGRDRKVPGLVSILGHADPRRRRERLVSAGGLSRCSSGGTELILISRDARPLAARFPHATVVVADLLDSTTLPMALRGSTSPTTWLTRWVRVNGNSLSGIGRQAATLPRGEARRRVADRLPRRSGQHSAYLSHHLASRHEKGAQLAAHGVPVTEFRAAVIVGSGSASFEILRHLTERLPIMITPRWVATRCQPIGIADVLDYLVGPLHHPEVAGVVEVGGSDILSYGDMMRTYARLRGLRRLMIPVPVLTPRLSSYWVNLLSSLPARIARPLIEGLRNEVVVRDPGPAAPFGIEPRSYVEALRRAIDRTDPHAVESTWFDALAASDRGSLSSVTSARG